MINKDFAKEQSQSTSKQIHQSDPRSQPILLPFLKLYSFIIGSGAIPVRLLFYRNIGERSISFLAWIISLAVHIYYVFVYAAGFSVVIAAAIFWFIDDNTLNEKLERHLNELGWFNLAFILFNGLTIYLVRCFLIEGWKHFSANHRKQNEITKTGSYYRGDPVFSKLEDYVGKTKWTVLGKKNITESDFKVYIESQKIIIFGLIVTVVFSVLPFLVVTFWNSLISSVIAIFLLSYNSVGVLMILSAICLILEEKGIEQRTRYAALDLIDGEKDLEQILALKKNFEVESSTSSKSKVNASKLPVVKIG